MCHIGKEVFDYLSSEEEDIPKDLNPVIRSAEKKVKKCNKNYSAQKLGDARYHLDELRQMLEPHVSWPSQADKEKYRQKCAELSKLLEHKNN